MLLFGSEVDKAHLRVSAAIAVLRLSIRWDSCVTLQLFHLTLRTAQVIAFALSISFICMAETDIVDEIVCPLQWSYPFGYFDWITVPLFECLNNFSYD